MAWMVKNMSNLPALLPSTEQFSQMKEIAQMAVRSGLVPLKSPEAAMLIALKGYELGLPPVLAFSHISVIQGKPTMSAELMLAYIYREYPNAEINTIERSSTRCEIKAKRPNEKEFTTFVWDMERAQRMGLAGKDNWRKQPETMLFWRAITEMKRSKFPEVLMGISYDPTELEDSGRDVTPSPVEPPQAPKEAKRSVKSIKNYAPQTSEEAKNWQPSQIEPVDRVETEEDRQALVLKVRDLILASGLSKTEVEKIVKDQFGKATVDLSSAELRALATDLESRLPEVING